MFCRTARGGVAVRCTRAALFPNKSLNVFSSDRSDGRTLSGACGPNTSRLVSSKSEVRRGKRSGGGAAGPNKLRDELAKSSVRAGRRGGVGDCGPMMLYLVRRNWAGGLPHAPGPGQQSRSGRCGPRMVVRGSLKSAGAGGLQMPVGCSSPWMLR